MLKVVGPTLCWKHGRCFFTLVHRSKSSKSDVRKIINLRRENELLFGPVLKGKDLEPKKNKTKKKKSVKDGISIIMEQARTQIVDQVDEADILDESSISSTSGAKKTKAKSSNAAKTTRKKSLSTEQTVSSKNKTSTSSRAQTPNGSESGEQAPSLFEFVLNFPLDIKTDMTGDESSDFGKQVEQMSLRTLPTVSSVINKTQSDMARFFLQRWRETSIAELGKEEFYKKQEGIKHDGINLHACIQQFLSGRSISDIQIQPRCEGYWESVRETLDKVGEVKAVEGKVVHPQLMYQGTYDCVASFRDSLCVIDWKTSQKPKPLLTNTFDNPLQLAAYLGAFNAGADVSHKHGRVTHAVIVIAYPWGEPAHVHVIDHQLCEKYWAQWCVRLHQYWNIVAREKGLQAKQTVSAV
ncbi:mitochondrial genome maintenance exonuclease 1-like [Haliotis rufescens]|uniref:mitochondrial genome maintenance exonuclease 1-like n=1 Tax=Haliotis rufescens TaxID=6454 RepID=UPI00201FAAAE|nr:mitochondrial genome maintenance exonuclease 1-like [Haliotis rufescens]